MSMEYSLSLWEHATAAFFNKFNPVCAHPGCLEPASTIAVAILPGHESQRGVTSLCEEHGHKQLEFLVHEGGFVPVGKGTTGALINLREQARLLRELKDASPEAMETIADLTGQSPDDAKAHMAELAEDVAEAHTELEQVPRVVVRPPKRAPPGAGAPTPTELRNLLAWAMTHLEGGEDLRDECFEAVRRFDAAKGSVENIAQELECGTHGEAAPWRGEIVCEECGRMYLLPISDDAKALPAEQLVEPVNPPYCDCGKLLTPSPDVPPAERETFTGRPVCSICYLEHAYPGSKVPAHHRGRGFRANIRPDQDGNGMPILLVTSAGKTVQATTLEVEIAPDVSGALLWMKAPKESGRGTDLSCAFLGPELTADVLQHVAIRTGGETGKKQVH